MTEEVKVDLAYVEEIFESREERIHFLMLMHAEFQEAIEHICLSIHEQNLYKLRKTLHNVSTHLEMLGTEELQDYLQQVKDLVSGNLLSDSIKQEMTERVKCYFNALLKALSDEIGKI